MDVTSIDWSAGGNGDEAGSSIIGTMDCFARVNMDCTINQSVEYRLFYESCSNLLVGGGSPLLSKLSLSRLVIIKEQE